MVRRLKSVMIRRTARLELANTLMALGAPPATARRAARRIDPRTSAEAQEAGRTLAAVMFDETARHRWAEAHEGPQPAPGPGVDSTGRVHRPALLADWALKDLEDL